MAKWQPARGWRRYLYTRTAIILVVIVGLLFARGVWAAWQRERLAVAERRQAELELAELQAREAELQREIALLQSERGLEYKIREKFLVTKAGEKVIAIVATGTASTTGPKDKSWWQKWFGE